MDRWLDLEIELAKCMVLGFRSNNYAHVHTRTHVHPIKATFAWMQKLILNWVFTTGFNCDIMVLVK